MAHSAESPGGGVDVRTAASRHQSAALATVCAVLFVTFLDNTVVSVTLADIQSRLHAGVTSLQWVVNGYALVFAALMLMGGTLGDLFGRKRIMLGGLVVFCAGSVVAALAPGIPVLIAGRAIMGVGAAASEPGTLSVLRHLYPDRAERARAVGVWAAVSGLALALGPVIAGVLVGIADWRAVFWFNLVFGIAVLGAAALVVPETSDPEGRSVDVLGLVFGAVALGASSSAVIAGEEAGYGTWWIVGLFVLAAVSALAFVLVELRVRSPILPLSFFRRSTFTGATIVAFISYFGIFSIFFFVALYVQLVVGQSPYRTALDFAPMAVLMVGASALTGLWVAAAGPRIPMTLGCLLAGAGMLLTDVVLNPHPAFVPLAAALALAGVGFGMAVVPVTSSALSAIPAERSGLAASATNTSREFGAVFGVAVLGAIVNAQLTGSLKARLQALGLPRDFQALVIQAVTHGTSGGKAATAKSGAAGPVIDEVVHAAEGAFASGLHTALTLSGALLFAGAVVAFRTIDRDRVTV